MKSAHTVILCLSLPLILLVSMVSLTGASYPGIYAQETPNWLAQTSGQDAVDLFLVIPLVHND